VETVPVRSFRIITIKALIWFARGKKRMERHNRQMAATPTVSSAMSMPMKLFSLADSGLIFVFPAALELAEVLELPVAEAVLEVILPLGMPEGRPGETPAWPIVGKAELGSTFQPVGVCVGQAGPVKLEAEAAYAEEATPVGERVAHWAWRFEKSGDTGVGVP
jgi:hypothetical protein